MWFGLFDRQFQHNCDQSQKPVKLQLNYRWLYWLVFCWVLLYDLNVLLLLMITIVVRRCHEQNTIQSIVTLTVVLTAWCFVWLVSVCLLIGGTPAPAPLPFRPGNPALCESHPLVTPYYCRLGICCVLCLYVCLLFFYVNCIFYVFLQSFDTVGWVFWPVTRKPSWRCQTRAT